MAFARIVSLLQKCDSAQPVFPVTELFNEGWLLRLILDWFSQQPHKPHPLAFTAKSLWFSEARLPSQFLARYRGDELAESWTHADGVIGHIEVGGSRKTDTSLLPGATQLVATEAKLFSKLSPGVTNARFFNQAARYVACIAEMLNIAQRPASDFFDLGFYVLAPVEQIDAGAFTPEMNPTQILEKVRQRVEQYGGEKDRWFQECFLPTLERIDIECLSWERIIEHINGEDSSFGVEITDYYRRCREYNRQKKTMKPRDFLPTMQRKVATTAVGPSALRNQGKGVLTAAQQFLADVSLSKVPRSDLNSFERWLDRETENLLNVFPIRGRPWGTARKALNLFLRDVLYNRYLCNKFGLMTIEPWLEIPLDSAVANGLKRLGQRGQLPRWPGLKRLTKPVSQIFQDFAGEFAEENEIERIHLDIYLWLENR